MSASPASYDFTIYAGATFSKVFTYYALDDSGVKTPVDLTTFAARLVAKINPTDTTVGYEFSTADGSITLGGVDGTITLLKTPNQTMTFVDSAFGYVLYLIDNSGNPLPPILIGTLTIDYSTLPSGGQ